MHCPAASHIPCRQLSLTPLIFGVCVVFVQAMTWHGDLWDCFSASAMMSHLQQKPKGSWEQEIPPVFEFLKGRSFWSYLSQDPLLQSNFGQAMQNVDSIGTSFCYILSEPCAQIEYYQSRPRTSKQHGKVFLPCKSTNASHYPDPKDKCEDFLQSSPLHFGQQLPKCAE